MAVAGMDRTGLDAEGMGEGAALTGSRGRESHEAELIAGGALVLLASFLYPYLNGVIDRVTPGCIFHRLTGIPCLLCGMTRSFAATSHGQLAEAFRLHLLGPPLFAALLAGTLALAVEQMMGRPILPRPDRRQRRILAWGALVLLVAALAARLFLFGVNV